VGESVPMQGHNQRVFPRIDLQCPISYRDQRRDAWVLSRLVDFSADGLRMVTDHPIQKNQTIIFQMRPDRQKILRGQGTVVRCVDQGNFEFHVAVKDIHWQHPETTPETKPENVLPKADTAEQRVFPRISAQCPVRYRESTTGRWLIGRMLDFSATGLLMTTDTNLEQGAQINVQVEPGSKKHIPALRGVGKVVRSRHIDDDHFEIGIKMLRIEPPSA
jgi:c-di-GMP-binding flagellar brake protein YcgR